MSASTTSRLGLVKPNPGTGELVNVATQINASYDKIDAAIGAAPCTSTTRPVSPFDGQLIRETDTGRVYVRSSGAWLRIVTSSGDSNLILTAGELNVNRPLATDTAVYAGVNGDSVGRFIVRADGQMQWGPGNAGRDVTLYRDSASVLKTDDTFVSSGVDVTSDNTNSVSITTTETIIATISNYTFIAGVAYEVKFFQPWFADADGRLANFKVHKTNAAGADWGEFFRFRSAGASIVMNASAERYLIRTAGAGNLTATVVLTAYAPEGGTITMRGNVANSPRWFMIRPCGIAAEYTGMATVVT